MPFLSDLKILFHLVASPPRGETQAERLEAFYRYQAEGYDDFRKRLLQGRRELWEALGIPRDGAWVDMGGGTGANLEYFGERIGQLGKIYIVDLCPSLLEVARRRVRDNEWRNVEVVQSDAVNFRPTETLVDAITFSYSLTMMPNWAEVLAHARSLLRDGGRIGVVDFFVNSSEGIEGCAPQSRLTRAFWRKWFVRDGVHLNPEHIPCLQDHFEQELLEDRRAKVPYLFGARVPYYLFVGKKD